MYVHWATRMILLASHFFALVYFLAGSLCRAWLNQIDIWTSEQGEDACLLWWPVKISSQWKAVQCRYVPAQRTSSEFFGIRFLTNMCLWSAVGSKDVWKQMPSVEFLWSLEDLCCLLWICSDLQLTNRPAVPSKSVRLWFIVLDLSDTAFISVGAQTAA